MQSNYDVSDFKPAQVWRKAEGSSVFPTPNAWAWFYRTHREDLIASGEVIPGKGTAPALVGPNIGKITLDLIRRDRLGAA